MNNKNICLGLAMTEEAAADCNNWVIKLWDLMSSDVMYEACKMPELEEAIHAWNMTLFGRN